MARVLVTGAADGLGLGATRELIEHGHTVIAHARTHERAAEVADLAGCDIVTGDLSRLDDVRSIVDQVANHGGVDAVINNAGVGDGPAMLPVNVVAPYVLSALIPADRVVILSSGMHQGGHPTLDGLDWSGQRATASYSDSKLLVTALAAAIGRRRPGVHSNAVDPGWVPTKMGGPSAPDDLEQGHHTQVWLAEGTDPQTHTSAYWHHKRERTPHRAVHDEQFQDALLTALADHTGITL